MRSTVSKEVVTMGWMYDPLTLYDADVYGSSTTITMFAEIGRRSLLSVILYEIPFDDDVSPPQCSLVLMHHS